MTKLPELITIKEFSSRTSLGYTGAWEMSRCKEFVNNKIAVKLNPLSNKRGGVRISWNKYLQFIEEPYKMALVTR